MSRYALVIGSNGPQKGNLNNLKYTEQDTKNIFTILKSPVAGYSVQMLYSPEYPQVIITEFEILASSCKSEDTLLFYFSGHGFYLRGQLYLVLESTDLKYPVSTAIPVSTIKSIFANSKAMVKLLILDCCHSGAAGEGQFRKGNTNHLYEAPLFETARESASIVLTACGRNEITREVKEFESGFLTHLLVDALSKKFLEVDKDKDGFITIQEFMEWASLETIKLNKNRLKEEHLDSPELYGDFRGAVYLTNYQYISAPSDELNDRLIIQLNKAINKIEKSFTQNRHLDYKKLEQLARPIRRIAPTFTKIDFLKNLFAKPTNANIFTAATILQYRRDPRYMESLIQHIDNGEIRGASNWRVLRAIRDTSAFYEFTSEGIINITKRLQLAAIQRDTKYGGKFAAGTTLNMIKQVCKKLKITPEYVFSEDQLRHINKK